MKANQKFRERKMNDRAASGVYALGAIALTIIGVILGAVIGMKVISQLLPGYASDTKNVTENLTTADFGDATANSIADVFGMVVGIAAVVAIVGLVLLAVTLSRRKS